MKTDSWRGALHDHRVRIVRSEQRATLLTRAFLLGVPYLRLESRQSKHVDTKRIVQIAYSLAWARITDQQILDWINHGKEETSTTPKEANAHEGTDADEG